MNPQSSRIKIDKGSQVQVNEKDLSLSSLGFQIQEI